MREQSRQMRSMIWPAVRVRVKGRAASFQSLIQSSSAVMSSSGEQNTPGCRHRLCSSASHHPAWLSQEVQAGAKCSTNRG
jgi:hypothetical protein